MRGEPCRTWGPPVHATRRAVVYRVVDEALRYVTIYVPPHASSADEVASTIMFALDNRRAPLPKEGVHDGR